jgi:MFS family permease
MAVMTHEAVGLSPAALDRARIRTRAALFASVALGSTGYLAAGTVASIVGQELLGSAALSGAPSATVIFGAAMGAIGLSWIMARRGRRVGLTAGYVAAFAGAVLATSAVVIRSFPLLLLGTFLIGWGNASNNLSRYAAADLVGPARRPMAIGLVVWGSTVGGLVGPSLVPLSGSIAPALGLPTLAGPYLVPILFVSAAAVLTFVFLRPDPFAIAHESAIHDPSAEELAPSISVREVLTRPAVVAAIAALLAGQATMTLIMTMTPLHLTAHNPDLGPVGVVISGHVAGMFALAPLSGWITQRVGTLRTIFLGMGVLIAASLLAALAPGERNDLLFIALFLLGWGWNLGFVAGSALLAASVSIAERTRIQGAADAFIWTTSAVASLGSGAIVAAAGFSALGLLGVAIVIAPAWLLLSRRDAIAGAAASA